LTGSEGSKILRLPNFKNICTWGWNVCQPSGTAAFTPRKFPVLISVSGFMPYTTYNTLDLKSHRQQYHHYEVQFLLAFKMSTSWWILVPVKPLASNLRTNNNNNKREHHTRKPWS
jgi:hypothetical protein